MKGQFFYFIVFMSTLTIIESCDTTSQLYRYDDINRKYSGQLSDSSYNALKHFLTTSTNSILKDTIIIKYDYNHETCWDLLDQKNDDYIMGLVKRHQERVQQVLATRQNISVFVFRERGNDINKIKIWDNSIMIDSSKKLYKLLFKKRCTCGSSIIVMPDKRFVFIRSDSHSEIIDLKKNQIEDILNKK